MTIWIWLYNLLTLGEVSLWLTKKPPFHKGRFGGNVNISGGPATNRELNLPRIASQSILGLNRRRLGIVNTFTLLSTCTIILCYTEQLSSLKTDRTADIGKSLDSHLFKEQIFGLSLFIFAQSLWRGAMKNDDLDSTGRTAKSSFK